MNRKVLITGATGDTGRVAVKESLALGLAVRAMVHGKDDRSAALEKLGAEVVVGDLHDIDTIREAMEGIDAAYLVYPVQAGLIDATVIFAQAAREAIFTLHRRFCITGFHWPCCGGSCKSKSATLRLDKTDPARRISDCRSVAYLFTQASNRGPRPRLHEASNTPRVHERLARESVIPRNPLRPTLSVTGERTDKSDH
jgi:NAD(P)-dependent dehydrogenase (short-subunit alcohol dehydrogenase family)